MELRPALARAKALLEPAALEPLCLQRARARPFDPHAWGGLLGCLSGLVTRVAALECVLEEQVQVGVVRARAHVLCIAALEYLV